MTDKCYSIDSECFNYDSLGELLDSEYLGLGDMYYEADKVDLDLDRMIASCVSCNLLEGLNERVYADVGECYNNEFSDVSKEAEAELVSLIKEWTKKHVKLDYWVVKNVVELKVTQEDID